MGMAVARAVVRVVRAGAELQVAKGTAALEGGVVGTAAAVRVAGTLVVRMAELEEQKVKFVVVVVVVAAVSPYPAADTQVIMMHMGWGVASSVQSQCGVRSPHSRC